MTVKKVGPSLYFASDKVIFDALNHRQVKTDVLRDLLFERGVIVSKDTPKFDLAHYFSRLTADYFDQKNIGIKLGRIAKRERITFAEVQVDLEGPQILAALNAVKEALQENGNIVDVEVKPDGRLLARISYEHVDYTEVEFRQVQPRDAVIEFVPDGEKRYFVRSTKNNFTDIAVAEVFGQIKGVTGHDASKTEVSLEGHADHLLRTKFFETLMHSMEGHDFVTVTEAYCYKPKVAAELKNTEDDEGAEVKDLEKQPYVERVSLKGDGVTRSFVIDELYRSGYYIIKVVWRVKPKKSLDSDVYELEAQFSEPESCTGFSYQAKHAYIFEDGELTDKKRLPKLEEDDLLFRLIERAAKTALSHLED